jgi:hypothetical protein
MSFDRIEVAATSALASESRIQYDRNAEGKPVFPRPCPVDFSSAVGDDPAEAWFALRATERDLAGSRRGREIVLAVDKAFELWKEEYNRQPKEKEPLPEYLAQLSGYLQPRNLAAGLSFLPPGAWSLRCELTLAKDFLSKDESAFGMTENPIRRGRAMRELIIAGSGWKGALRNAFRAAHGSDTPEEIRLFGPAKRNLEDEDGLGDAARGRLVFYPTYILPAPDHTRLRVINPHSREKKIGLNPIVYEVIKQGTNCSFELLYLPWGRGTKATPEQRGEDASDMRMTGEALRAMFRDLGAGGKTTSGFGTFSVRDGKLVTRDKSHPFPSMKKLVDAFAKASGGQDAT